MRVLPLLLIACAAAAEDQPVPAPKPVAGTAVPTPAAPAPPSPTAGAATPPADGTAPPPLPAPGPNPTPPAPSTGAPTPSGVGSRGSAAGAAGAAGAAAPRLFTLALELDAGEDSNVLYQDTSNNNATKDRSLDLGGDVRATYHAMHNPEGTLVNLIGDVRYDDYPSVNTANYLRGGLAAVGQLHFALIDPGMVLSVNRLYIGDAGVATIGRISATATHIDKARQNVDSLIVDCQPVHYDNDDPDSGVLYDLLWRHWWLFTPGDAHRRIEVSIGAGDFAAHATTSSYRSVTPGLAIKERVDRTPLIGGVVDAAIGTQLEARRYADAYAGFSDERQLIWSASASADRWLSQPDWAFSLSLGIYAIYTFRDSNIDGRSYRRFQEGIRLLATW